MSPTMQRVIKVSEIEEVQRAAFAIVGPEWQASTHTNEEYLQAAVLYQRAADMWRELPGRDYEVKIAERMSRKCREKAGCEWSNAT